MIIICVKCHKKFDVNGNLIPDRGKLLQCGSCNHQWYFKKDIIYNKNEKIITDEEIISDEKTDDSADSIIETVAKTNNDTKIDLEYKENRKNKSNYKILKLIIVFIISFIASIIFLDTFKGPIAKFIPNIEFILYNLYESIKDIKLFINDLI
ncbi:zinc-ribbon domain-containing protein [Candidatus Pelagibacter bacterium]|nr:zinc-ribbon domain-containing protein [Candidatus Pelagibacter bacterium]